MIYSMIFFFYQHKSVCTCVYDTTGGMVEIQYRVPSLKMNNKYVKWHWHCQKVIRTRRRRHLCRSWMKLCASQSLSFLKCNFFSLFSWCYRKIDVSHWNILLSGLLVAFFTFSVHYFVWILTLVFTTFFPEPTFIRTISHLEYLFRLKLKKLIFDV